MIHVIDIEKAGKSGLVATTVRAMRGGIIYDLTVYKRPGGKLDIKQAGERYPGTKVKLVTTQHKQGVDTEGKPLQPERHIIVQPRGEGLRSYLNRKMESGDIVVKQRGVITESVRSKDSYIKAKRVGGKYKLKEGKKPVVEVSLDEALGAIAEYLKKHEKNQN